MPRPFYLPLVEPGVFLSLKATKSPERYKLVIPFRTYYLCAITGLFFSVQKNTDCKNVPRTVNRSSHSHTLLHRLPRVHNLCRDYMVCLPILSVVLLLLMLLIFSWLIFLSILFWSNPVLRVPMFIHIIVISKSRTICFIPNF